MPNHRPSPLTDHSEEGRAFLQARVDVGGDVEVTGDNTVIGTPQYMAPESIMNPDSADARSDIYALGAVAYYLLAGTDVFNGRSVVELLSQHLSQKPEPLSARRGISVPAKLEAVVMSCLDKDPSGRPQTAVELRGQIDACRIEPWDRAATLAWWREHPAVAETDAAMNPSDARTNAVDGIHR
ncbi:MAG: protein kinase [Vicinamibacterales bacterium]|jgi:serine/threonine protein kinase